jgi:hypothetical protein
VIDLNPGGTSYRVDCAPTSQGFCDCTSPLGLMSDDVRSVIPGIYRPQYAGPYFVGGARETTDVLAVPDGPARLVAANVAPVEEVRAAWVNGELICCAYVASGVWVWRGTPTVIAPPVPETWTESPVGTLVTHLWRFCVGASQTGWVRDGTHRMDCYREPNAATFCKFGSATAWEYWGLAPEGTVWHLQDASATGGNDARGQSYAWSNGRWLNATMRVGERIDNLDNQMRWYRDGQWTAWQPHPFAVTLDAHETCSDGRERCTWSYHYGPQLAVREVYVGDSDLGWWSWTLHEAGATHHSEWPTIVTATPIVPVGNRVPWPAQRPIVVTPPVDPEKPPVPVQFPPRNETYDFAQQLDAYYRDVLQRPLSDAHFVDFEGEIIWTQQYLLYRVNGATHDQAVARVKQDIDHVVHPPQHTSAVVGALSVGDA